MKKAPKKELGEGRIAFLARKEDIKKEVERGRTVMSIWREFGKELGIGYTQLDRYVNRHIKNKQESPKTVDAKIKDKKLSTVEIFDLPMDKKDIF